MDHKLDEFASRWHLSARDRTRLEHAAHAAAGDGLADHCRDIDRALGWLLGDRQAILDWLRRPLPGLYHATPLAVILGPARGRRMLRAALLKEAAENGDSAACIAAGAQP